jgi:hypothetical protein
MPKFEKSTRKDKKYSVITESGKKIHFGNINFQHYKDNTGLGLYSHLNHLDKKRRDNYRARHKAILKKDGTPAYLDKEQPAYFSYKYLW